MKLGKTAILLFAQHETDEVLRKKWDGPGRPDETLFAALNDRTKRIAQGSGLPVLRSCDLIDHSGTFGQQMVAGLEAAFRQGYDQLIVIGNDCPSLDSKTLLKAAEHLDAGSTPIGPDGRGGAYLIGCHRHQLAIWRQLVLPWRTKDLLSALWSFLNDSGEAPALLEMRRDLYRVQDIVRSAFSGHIGWKTAVLWLQYALNSSQPAPILTPILLVAGRDGMQYSRRGPPSY